MAKIINVLGNSCIQSYTFDNLTASHVMCVCERFVSEHHIMPEEIFIIASGKLIEIDLKSVLQFGLDKQLQG